MIEDKDRCCDHRLPHLWPYTECNMTSIGFDQQKKAESFLKLHLDTTPFVLANAWDVASARIFELAGFKAIGTTSAGIAATLGFPDGQRISVHDSAEVVRRLVRRINLPVSADLEAGYAASIEGVVESARIMLDAGAVGINIEDGTGNPRDPLLDKVFQAEKISAIREMATKENIHLVINARTDTFLTSTPGDTSRFPRTVERARAYREAGADCIFVPDFEDLDRETMKRLVKEIDAPINVIAGSKTPPLRELEEIGIARVSLGPRHMRATFSLLRKIATEIMEKGTFTNMTADAFSYSDVKRMFE